MWSRIDPGDILPLTLGVPKRQFIFEANWYEENRCNSTCLYYYFFRENITRINRYFDETKFKSKTERFPRYFFSIIVLGKPSRYLYLCFPSLPPKKIVYWHYYLNDVCSDHSPRNRFSRRIYHDNEILLSVLLVYTLRYIISLYQNNRSLYVYFFSRYGTNNISFDRVKGSIWYM